MEHFTALQYTAGLVGLFFAGRFVAQMIAAANALRGLAAAAVLARLGLAAITNPFVLGGLAVVTAAIGLYALTAGKAAEATTKLARETERFLERGIANSIDVLRGAITKYERQIVDLREQLNQPLSLQGRLNLRAQLAQYEEELSDFRVRLRQAQESAVTEATSSVAVTPEAAPGAAAGRPRNVGADISAEIERQERASRQRIEILRAEGQARLQLEARYEVTNRLVDEQLRLTAALSSAKDAERAQLQAEQQALDRTVAGVDALIAAKERQLRLDQQAGQLQVNIAERLQEAERQAEALTRIAGQASADRVERLGLLRQQLGYVEETAAGWLEVLENERRATLEARRHTAVARLATEALADGLANAAAHARSLSDALRSIALTLTSSLLRNILPGLIGGLFSGGASSFASGSTTSVFGNLGPLTFRQHGGPVSAGQERYSWRATGQSGFAPTAPGRLFQQKRNGRRER